MNAKERAFRYLAIQECYRNPKYREIDECIKPIVEWMNENGYVTLHSCAGHEDRQGVQQNYWYVWFVATVSIKPLRQRLQRLPFKVQLKIAKYPGLTRSWIASMFVEPRTELEIRKRNQEVFTCLTKKQNNSLL